MPLVLGTGGNLTVNANTVTMQGGSRIGAAASSSGQGGTIAITTGTLEITGQTSNGNTPSAITATTFGSGNAGQVTLRGDRITVANRAAVNSSTLGSGNAGQILIQSTDTLDIDNAVVAASVGANATGNGGNISLTAPNITLANGAIDIEATQIYGFSTLGYLTRFSDITASSEFGAAGIIALDTNFDAAQGVNELPTDLSDRTDQIFDACSTVGNNRFTIMGRGGVGEMLQPTLGHADEWQDTRTIAPSPAAQSLLLEMPEILPLPPMWANLTEASRCANPFAAS